MVSQLQMHPSILCDARILQPTFLVCLLASANRVNWRDTRRQDKGKDLLLSAAVSSVLSLSLVT